ncbi:hypothetical protein EIP91_003063 [Steccherinum ochraceum]|uniref:Uncharacterized protein n=1 Tax=Steccherinum ochraceum TaxID=92696 RepID=A0A4R0RCP1_9APHY|nr:hypothetical protein EIP91_003063 [Steccherinum ochraceum]
MSNTRSYIDQFYRSYPGFRRDRRLPYKNQFYALCDHMQWDKKDEDRQEALDDLKEALVAQFNDNYGQDANDIQSWRTLCEAIGLDPPARLQDCREMVRSTHVNLVDLALASEDFAGPVQIFDSEWELAKYTRETKKFFPRAHVSAGGVLKFLLRRILDPSDPDESGARGSKRKRDHGDDNGEDDNDYDHLGSNQGGHSGKGGSEDLPAHAAYDEILAWIDARKAEDEYPSYVNQTASSVAVPHTTTSRSQIPAPPAVVPTAPHPAQPSTKSVHSQAQAAESKLPRPKRARLAAPTTVTQPQPTSAPPRQRNKHGVRVKKPMPVIVIDSDSSSEEKTAARAADRTLFTQPTVSTPTQRKVTERKIYVNPDTPEYANAGVILLRLEEGRSMSVMTALSLASMASYAYDQVHNGMPLPTQRSRTHIEDFYAQYPGFYFDAGLPWQKQFHALCDHCDWKWGNPVREEALKALKRKLVLQFNEVFGEDGDDMRAWRSLCQILRIYPVPPDLVSCRRAVQAVHVNLVDLTLSKTDLGGQLQIFDSEYALSEYTKETAKWFPRNDVRTGGVLKYLLRHIHDPEPLPSAVLRAAKRKHEDDDSNVNDQGGSDGSGFGYPLQPSRTANTATSPPVRAVSTKRPRIVSKKPPPPPPPPPRKFTSYPYGNFNSSRPLASKAPKAHVEVIEISSDSEDEKPKPHSRRVPKAAPKRRPPPLAREPKPPVIPEFKLATFSFSQYAKKFKEEVLPTVLASRENRVLPPSAVALKGEPLASQIPMPSPTLGEDSHIQLTSPALELEDAALADSLLDDNFWSDDEFNATQSSKTAATSSQTRMSSPILALEDVSLANSLMDDSFWSDDEFNEPSSSQFCASASI